MKLCTCGRVEGMNLVGMRECKVLESGQELTLHGRREGSKE